MVVGCQSILGIEDPVRVGDDASVIDGGGEVDANVAPDAAPPLPNAVDILFVIDNSGGMEQEQAALSLALPTFLTTLENAAGVRPSLHIGIVSTDVGTGPFPINFCEPGGDDGVLQSMAQAGGCTPPSGRFIIDEIDDPGRVINYPAGQLSETFSCIAQLGIDGCGFEQPLESMRRALDGSRAQNAGFVRDGALLAIVFLTDEDDCSASDTMLFDTAQTEIDSELGPLSSYRCFEFGVACEPDSRTALGPRADCVSRADSLLVFDVSVYIDFLRSRKPVERLVVSGIIGPATPVSVEAVGGNPEVEPSCTSASGVADPGIRLQALLDAFPGRSTSHRICVDDLSSELSQIAALIADNLPQ